MKEVFLGAFTTLAMFALGVLLAPWVFKFFDWYMTWAMSF